MFAGISPWVLNSGLIESSIYQCPGNFDAVFYWIELGAVDTSSVINGYLSYRMAFAGQLTE